MLTKLASLLATAKGAAAAAVIAGSAVTGGTAAAVPEVRDALTESASTVTTTLGSAVAAVAKAATERRAADTFCGRPEVVAQRNEADKQLRDAFHDDHKTLTALKGGKDTDHQKVNAIVKLAQAELRARLTLAVVEVARETQGRTGQVAKANTPQTTLTGDTTACDPPGGKQDVELSATLAAMIEAALKDMDAIVTKATTAAGAVPPAERGKPASDPARANEKKVDAKGQPSDTPHGKPSASPGRAR